MNDTLDKMEVLDNVVVSIDDEFKILNPNTMLLDAYHEEGDEFKITDIQEGFDGLEAEITYRETDHSFWISRKTLSRALATENNQNSPEKPHIKRIN